MAATATFLSYGKTYVKATNGGGSNVTVDAATVSSATQFKISDLTHTSLTSGDKIYVQAENGNYLSAQCGGGTGTGCGVVDANRTVPLSWETFTIEKVGGSAGALLEDGDSFSLTATGGDYCTAEVNGGGPGSYLTCNRPVRAGWETFVLGGLSTSTPTPPPPTSGLTAAQAFMADLALGIQIPRGQQGALTYNGTKLYESAAFFEYLAGMGVTHVGFSYPYTPAGSSAGDLSFIGTPSVTDSYFTSMIAAAKLAQAAGLKVAMRLTDNLSIPADFGTTLTNWEKAAGAAVASSGLKPSMTLVIPWGEMAGSDNKTCNPLANAGNQTLRSVLPQSGGWILGVSGAYWASSTVINGDSSGEARALVTLSNGQTDDQVVYVFDDYPFYDQGLQSSEAGFASSIAKWQGGHGNAPVLELETGDWHGQYDTNPGNPGAWASSYMPIAEGCGLYAPTLWDLSDADGSANQATLTNGSEATLSAANEAGLKAAAAYVKQQSYQGSAVR